MWRSKGRALSRLVLDLMMPDKYDKQVMTNIIRAICNQVNTLSEGKIQAKYNAQASVPADVNGSYQVGDFIPDTNCTVRGSVAPGIAASYIREGWLCVSPGTGATATFAEKRVLTGT